MRPAPASLDWPAFLAPARIDTHLVKLPPVLDYPFVLARNRELLWSFIWRELKARYLGSLLGRLWPILNPLIVFLLFYFVFAVIMRMRLVERGVEISDASAVGLYIISGILPWIFFSEALNRCTGVVLENGNLVKKIAFPSQLLPTYAVGVNLIYFLISLVVFLVARLCFFYDIAGRKGLPDTWPLLFVAIPLQVVFTTGLGLFLGALNIFVRDTSQIIGLVLQLIFFLTPIVYTSELIRVNAPQYLGLLELNPLYHLMEMYRAALVIRIEGATPWHSAGVFALVAFVTFILGYAFFLKTKGRFADEI